MARSLPRVQWGKSLRFAECRSNLTTLMRQHLTLLSRVSKTTTVYDVLKKSRFVFRGLEHL